MVALQRDFGPVEFLVLTGDGEPFDRAAVLRLEPFGVAEVEADFAILGLHPAVDGAAVFCLLEVSASQRGESEALADILFVFRVDVARFTEVYTDGHLGARDFQRGELRLANLRPIAVGGLLAFREVIGELHEEETELALLARDVLRSGKLEAPREDHRREHRRVELHVSTVVEPRVALALIP